MGAISKLSEKCRKCPAVKICDNKRMEACEFKEMPKKLSSNCVAPLTSTSTASMARAYNPVTIKMGDYGDINTSLEKIKEKMEKDFWKNSNLNCAFNKS